MSYIEHVVERCLSSRKDLLIEELSKNFDTRIVKAIEAVPRHKFVPLRYLPKSYADTSLDLPKHKRKVSISQPTVVAQMTELLNPLPIDSVLEIGTGTGYQAAVLSKLAKHVVTVDVFQDLTHHANVKLAGLGIDNVDVVQADGSIPFTNLGVFDKIIITASMPPLKSASLFSLLKNNGVCVVPVGGKYGVENLCDLISIRKSDNAYILEERIPGFSFVPMQGIEGWSGFHDGLTLNMYKYYFGELDDLGKQE